MQKYLANLKLGVYRYRQYPLEFVFIVLKRILQIIFIVIFWRIITSGTDSGPLLKLIIYFLLFNSTADLIMVQTFELGNRIARMIHTGELNNVLIKPVNPQLYIFSKTVGFQLPLILLSSTAILVLIFMGELVPGNLPYFFLYLFLAVMIGVNLNSILASFAFYFTKIFGLREIFKYMTRIFSGSFIPIFLMPAFIVKILDLSFLSYIGYKPVMIMLGEISPSFKDIGIGVIWVILTGAIAGLFWKRSIEKYEAYGI